MTNLLFPTLFFGDAEDEMRNDGSVSVTVTKVMVRPNTDPVVQVMTDAKLHLAGGRRTQCNGQEIVNTFVKSSLDLAIIIFLCITA